MGLGKQIPFYSIVIGLRCFYVDVLYSSCSGTSAVLLYLTWV
jgi:hypothetical protein